MLSMLNLYRLIATVHTQSEQYDRMRRFSFSEGNNGIDGNKGKDDPGLGISVDKKIFVSDCLDKKLYTRLLSSLSTRLWGT